MQHGLFGGQRETEGDAEETGGESRTPSSTLPTIGDTACYGRHLEERISNRVRECQAKFIAHQIWATRIWDEVLRSMDNPSLIGKAVQVTFPLVVKNA